MIFKLKESKDIKLETVGKEIHNIFQLWANGIEITDTLCITRDLFAYYLNNNFSIAEQIIQKIVSELNSIGLSKSPYIYVQVSTNKRCVGIYDKINIYLNYSAIKYTIEKIYRSWSEDKARSFRLTNRLRDEDTYPSIYIQSSFDVLQSLVSRNPVNGKPISKENFKHNIHNTLPNIEPKHIDLLIKSESIVKYPCKIFFKNEERIVVCKIKEQIITNVGALCFVNEFYKKHLIDAVEYLIKITPQMFVETYQEYVIDDQMALYGLPASPGVAIGSVAFRSSNPDSLALGGYILIIRNVSPDDFEIIKRAKGVVGIREGLTSHLAVMCRGLGKPAVMSYDIELTHENDKDFVVLQNGKKFADSQFIAIDGRKGLITFSDVALINKYKEITDVSNCIGNVIGAFKSVESNFAQLSLDTQLHIAGLKKIFRESGWLN